MYTCICRLLDAVAFDRGYAPLVTMTLDCGCAHPVHRIPRAYKTIQFNFPTVFDSRHRMSRHCMCRHRMSRHRMSRRRMSYSWGCFSSEVLGSSIQPRHTVAHGVSVRTSKYDVIWHQFGGAGRRHGREDQDFWLALFNTGMQGASHAQITTNIAPPFQNGAKRSGLEMFFFSPST